MAAATSAASAATKGILRRQRNPLNSPLALLFRVSAVVQRECRVGAGWVGERQRTPILARLLGGRARIVFECSRPSHSVSTPTSTSTPPPNPLDDVNTVAVRAAGCWLRVLPSVPHLLLPAPTCRRPARSHRVGCAWFCLHPCTASSPSVLVLSQPNPAQSSPANANASFRCHCHCHCHPPHIHLHIHLQQPHIYTHTHSRITPHRAVMCC